MCGPNPGLRDLVQDTILYLSEADVAALGIDRDRLREAIVIELRANDGELLRIRRPHGVLSPES